MPEYSQGSVLDSPNPAASTTPTGRLSQRDQLKRARLRVDHAKKWRKTQDYDSLWRRLVDLYRGKHFVGLSTVEDRISVNISFATINVIGPSVATNYPKITVNARRQDEDSQATIAEAVINYWWRHYKFKPEFRRAVDDWLIIGHGWLKVGWTFKERQVSRDPNAVQSDFQQMQDQADTFAAENPDMAGNLPSDQDIIDSIDQYEMQTLEDCPFLERVSPWDMLVDPEATSLADAKWIAQRLVKPIEDARNDQRYQAKARKNLKPDGTIYREWQDPRTDGDKRRDDVKRVTLWEFYDLKAGTVSVFAETAGDDYLIKPTQIPFAFGHPFVMLRNYDVPDYFYPIGELEMLEPLQHELNKTRSQLVSYRRKLARKFLYRKNAFGKEGLRALSSSNDNEMVPVEDDRPFKDLAAPLEQIPIDAQLFHYSEQMEADVDRISGISEYQRGQLPELRRTATEAALIQDNANARASDKLAQVESVTAEVASRLVQLAQTYLTSDEVARVVGVDGSKLWVPFNRDDIQGEFDFDVEAGSTQPHNDTYKRQQATQLLQTMQPFIGTVLDPAQVLMQVLRDGFGFQNPERFLMQAQPDEHHGPSERLIESINYKDVPPDIQRQIEAQAGLTPSQVGGSSAIEAHAHDLATQQLGQEHQVAQSSVQHAHDAIKNLANNDAKSQALHDAAQLRSKTTAPARPQTG